MKKDKDCGCNKGWAHSLIERYKDRKDLDKEEISKVKKCLLEYSVTSDQLDELITILFNNRNME
jgi:hypothetical protein